MAIREKAFSRERCLEALLLIASELGPASAVDVLRVRYAADKLHLSKFGFFPGGSEYVAGADGAVEAGTARLLEAAWQEMDASAPDRRFLSLLKGSVAVEPPGGKDRVKAHRKPEPSFLSDSELQCVRQAAAHYLHLAPEAKSRTAKDEAWSHAWNKRAAGATSAPIPITEIARTLENAEEVLAYLEA